VIVRFIDISGYGV